jgi:hypothetical protein
MARGRLSFRETDLTRAMRAAHKLGEPFHVRIDRVTGDILILPGSGQLAQGARPAADNDDPDAELEAWRRDHGYG